MNKIKTGRYSWSIKASMKKNISHVAKHDLTQWEIPEIIGKLPRAQRTQVYHKGRKVSNFTNILFEGIANAVEEPGLVLVRRGETSIESRYLRSGQKFGHQFQIKSLKEDKLGFLQPSLSTRRLHGQVYQQSRIYDGIV
jgi:hypothetical protein